MLVHLISFTWLCSGLHVKFCNIRVNCICVTSQPWRRTSYCVNNAHSVVVSNFVVITAWLSLLFNTIKVCPEADCAWTVTTHPLSIECVDWPKLYDILNYIKKQVTLAHDMNFRQLFWLGFVPWLCYSSSFYHDVFVRIESRCVIKTKKCLFILVPSYYHAVTATQSMIGYHKFLFIINRPST